MHVEIIKTHPQFIHMKLGRKGETPRLLSVVYGSPNSSLRKFLWKDLSKENLDLTYPWLIMGDFNSVTAVEEVSNLDKLVMQYKNNNSISDRSYVFILN